MLGLYTTLTAAIGKPVLRVLLEDRCEKGKEDRARLPERAGLPSLARPDGHLIWLHAASVGEAQSALILIDAVLARLPDVHVLVTSGTVTSATLMAKRLPPRALHQFCPLDQPEWVAQFLDYWEPSAALWMESELWPNMLAALRAREIPSALINARLSPRSFKIWKMLGKNAQTVLGTFSVILTQTKGEAGQFKALKAPNVIAAGNIKYSAAPLPCEPGSLTALKTAIANRPLWTYASTHAGEEELACRLHARLKTKIPNLLTVIVPRHPERRADVKKVCDDANLKSTLRGPDHAPPAPDDDIYIADTLGELGLFYSLAPVACIGRSFSNDGGGGHNPLEAAQLGCAVLHGPNVQNLGPIFADMDKAGAALRLTDEDDFYAQLEKLMTDPSALSALREKSVNYAAGKTKVLDTVMTHIGPLLDEACA